MPERAPGDRVAGAREHARPTSRKLRQPGRLVLAPARARRSSSMSACQTARSAVLPVITVASKPGRALLDQVAADVAVLVARPDDHHVGDRRVADPALAAVEHVLVAVAARAASRAGPRPSRGRARSARTRRSPPGRAIAGSQRSLLLLGAEQRDRLHGQVGVDAEERADAAVGARPLHAHQPGRGGAHAGAAVALDGAAARAAARRSSGPARTGTRPAPSSR